MQDYINDSSDYYAKTFVFIQSSGMSKLRLADAFGESCLILNYILYKDNGYPSGNTNILLLMLSKPLDKVKKTIDKSPTKIAAIGSPLVKNRRATAIWNHSVRMGLLYSSFEIYELCALLTFVASTNLMCLIVNQWVERHDFNSSFKDLPFIRHQIIALLDLNEVLTGDLANNRRNQ